MKPLGPSPGLSGWHFASQLPKKGKGSSSSPQWKNSRRPAGPQLSARWREHLRAGRWSPCAAGRRVHEHPGVDRSADRGTHVRFFPRPRGAAARVASRVRFPGQPRDRRGWGSVRGPAWRVAEGEARVICHGAVESLFLSAGVLWRSIPHPPPPANGGAP